MRKSKDQPGLIYLDIIFFDFVVVSAFQILNLDYNMISFKYVYVHIWCWKNEGIN